MRKATVPPLLVVLGGLALCGCLDLEVVTHQEYHDPAAKAAAGDDLVDDRPEGKAPAFDPALADPRPLGGWRVNNSAAVFRLDAPAVKPDVEGDFLTLRPSYAAAASAARKEFAGEVLPSVNMLDGKAKSFDDGLYAALDLAYYRGLRDRLRGHVELVRRVYEKVGKEGAAGAFLAAGLGLAGVQVEAADSAAKEQYVRSFLANEVASKPVGFYTWGDELKACFRFLRFFQREFRPDERAVPEALARALSRDPALLADYRKAVDFYAKLSNPCVCLCVADLIEGPGRLKPDPWAKKADHRTVSFFPASTSRETVLFEKLFPGGLPPSANLMGELIRRIRSGEVDLRPRPGSGWYEYQVYALETLLLPEKGPERDKLLLTRAYKKRTLEAFKALITTRRETHVRQMSCPLTLGASSIPNSRREKVCPRLRVEPSPSYFLRTARAYAFLLNFLESAVGREGLESLHGLRKEGPRQPNLYEELCEQRDLFYGLYFLCAEDLGMRPELAKDEPVERGRCRKLAEGWLPGALEDPDLAADRRVIVPVFVDAERGVTKVWATLGVRLARLEASYARPPHLKPAEGEGEWQPASAEELGPARYVIPVDEFAEVELQGVRVPTREEFRALCDRAKTRKAILEALARGR